MSTFYLSSTKMFQAVPQPYNHSILKRALFLVLKTGNKAHNVLCLCCCLSNVVSQVIDKTDVSPSICIYICISRVIEEQGERERMFICWFPSPVRTGPR